MCKARFHSDALCDMISTTVHKMNADCGDLRRRVLLKSVRRSLKSELSKQQRRLRRRYNALASALKKRDEALKMKEEPDDGAQEDILGLDGFFISLKRPSSAFTYMSVINKRELLLTTFDCG